MSLSCCALPDGECSSAGWAGTCASRRSYASKVSSRQKLFVMLGLRLPHMSQDPGLRHAMLLLQHRNTQEPRSGSCERMIGVLMQTQGCISHSKAEATTALMAKCMVVGSMHASTSRCRVRVLCS